MLELHLFGGLSIQLDHQPVTGLVSRKADALVAYLACNPHVYPREVLADLFWDDRSQNQAMGNLRVVLNSLRRELAEQITITRQTVHIPRTHQLWVDAAEFECFLIPLLHAAPNTTATITGLQKALNLYKGEFLAGFFLREAHQFEEWMLFERERHHIAAVKAAQTLTHHYLASQDYGQGIQTAQRWVQLDMLNEEAHRILMELLVYNGQRTAALEHYQQHLSKSTREGFELSSEFSAFYQQLTRDELTIQVEGLHPAPMRLENYQTIVPHNLPSSLTPMIGREEELRQIQDRLEDSTCRLLTVMGLGGVGKTRLAIEAAQILATAPIGSILFRDGIYLVRLERIESDELLPSVIANALNYTFQGPLDPIKQLHQYLRSRRLLLILDNYEHLLHYSNLLLEILQHAPHVKILVTSRTRLEFLGEWILPIEGLSHPAIHTATRSSSVHRPKTNETINWDEFPATNLFIHTARALQPNFDPDQEQLSIIEICQTVDGLPLAIQLTAAAVHSHSCQEIAASIRRNLDFIQSNMRNVPERHRSLRAVFNHSWQLLPPAEKEAFTNLAIFMDGFSADQAEAVADVSKEILTNLINKSLIQQLEGQIDGSTQRYRRYRMHPVLHQYATEELTSDPENEAGRGQRHCLYFCHFAVEQQTILESAKAAEASAALALEINNLRASWRYALRHCQDELLLTMLPALMRFYLLRGFLQDALAILENAIGEVGGWVRSEPFSQSNQQRLLTHLFAHKAEVLIELGRYDSAIVASQKAIGYAKSATDHSGEALGHLHWGVALNSQGLYKQAKEKLQYTLTLAQQQELSQIEAAAHRYLGVNSFYQGDYTAGRLHHEAAIRLYQEREELINELRTYHSLAMLYFYTGDYSQARQHYERCRQAYQDIHNLPSLSLTLNNLGAVSSHLGDYTKALRSFEDALSIRREIGDRQMEGLILANMGLLVHLMNNNRLALEYCTQALEVSLELGERDTEAYARTCLGHALLELGRVAEAITNYEQAVQIRKNNDQLTQMLEPLAGLARAHLRLRETDAALDYVEAILPHLNVHTSAGIVELIRIYLSCYRVLYLTEDPRANEILTMGHMILQERAAKITDKHLRKYYFENIIAHRELMTEYETNAAVG